jgi:hypothetical protein
MLAANTSFAAFPVPAAVLAANRFFRSLSDDLKAVHITADAEAGEQLRERWQRVLSGVPLVIVETPNRSLAAPCCHLPDGAYWRIEDRSGRIRPTGPERRTALLRNCGTPAPLRGDERAGMPLTRHADAHDE